MTTPPPKEFLLKFMVDSGMQDARNIETDEAV